jgi:hypothetical protein
MQRTDRLLPISIRYMLEDGGFEPVWNGEAFRKSRAAIAAARRPDLHPICSTCHVFRSVH